MEGREGGKREGGKGKKRRNMHIELISDYSII